MAYMQLFKILFISMVGMDGQTALHRLADSADEAGLMSRMQAHSDLITVPDQVHESVHNND